MSHIVVIGGGTGTFTVLSGLKSLPHRITAIVAMSDDGGSTGRLRTELGVLPPGDVRQCLVALSEEEKLMLELMNYRFRDGEFTGHTFGNLLLSALEKVTGDFREAVRAASKILKIRGEVVPVTTDHTSLVAFLPDGTKVEGETTIDDAPPAGTENAIVDHVELVPTARANPDAVEAIRTADMIVIGPGDFWGSIIANLCVKGIPEAIAHSSARVVFIMNLMTRWGQRGFTTEDFLLHLKPYVEPDVVLINNAPLRRDLVAAYAKDNEYPIEDTIASQDGLEIIHTDLVSLREVPQDAADPIKRSLIRHDSQKLAKALEPLL